MQEYQKRVIEEKKELDLKIVKLNTFLHVQPMTLTYTYAERDRLQEQLKYMDGYARVLRERIEHFI